jgi:hypothetical protein
VVRNSHHGENIHSLNQIPERREKMETPDVKVTGGANRTPAEMKRLTHHTKKRNQSKKNP